MALPNLPLYAGVFNGYNTVPAAASLLLRVETNTQFGSPQPSGEIASAINLVSYDTLQAAAAGWSQRNQSVTYRILDVNGNVLDTSGYLDVFTQDPSFPDGTWNRNPGTYFIEVTNPNPSAPLVVEVANHGSAGDSSVLTEHTAQVLSPTPTPTRSNIKFSQRSIKGLPEALAALSLAVSTQGTNSSQALTDAIASEVAARNGAITNAIATEVANRDAAINAAVQGVLGSAPEALDTLKEIADYIAVNPSANVADAINAAIAAANQAVTDLTAAVDAEKVFSDWKESRAIRIHEEDIVLAEIDTDGFAAATTTYPALTVLNYGDARYIDLLTGVYYDLAVTKTSDFSIHKIDFNGLQDEVGAVAGKTVRIQYVTTHEAMGVDNRAQYNS
jgi:hypothetical protein